MNSCSNYYTLLFNCEFSRLSSLWKKMLVLKGFCLFEHMLFGRDCYELYWSLLKSVYYISAFKVYLLLHFAFLLHFIQELAIISVRPRIKKGKVCLAIRTESVLKCPFDPSFTKLLYNDYGTIFPRSILWLILSQS